MRLIDGDALKQYLDACEYCDKCPNKKFNCDLDCELPDFLTAEWERVIDEQPTINPEQMRKTGKWIKAHGFATPGGDPVWQCSECGKGIHVYGIEHITYGQDISNHQWVACPNCDAKMIGEQYGND